MKHFKHLVFILFLCTLITGNKIVRPEAAEAAQNISREEFLQMVVEALGIQIDAEDTTPYITAALEHGIITKWTFGTDYKKSLSRSDAAVILARADEYLYEETVSDALIEFLIDSRISDIEKAGEARRPYIAKCFQLGYLVGRSDGLYTKTRTFQPAGKISRTTAALLVERLLDISKREPMTKDGQLIRTTNLPDYADKYEYILDSFPNEFYDWDFYFMSFRNNGQKKYLMDDYKEIERWAYPRSIKAYSSKQKYWYYNINKQETVYDKELFDNCKYKWVQNVEDYLKLAFNVDYRTLKTDKEWIDGMKNVIVQEGSYERKLEKYINAAVKNKTIIECDKVAADISSIYAYSGQYVVRCYVHYRINSAITIDRSEDFVSPILYGGYWGTAYLLNYKEGEWRDGYFDVEVTQDTENLGVTYCNFCDTEYIKTE